MSGRIDVFRVPTGICSGRGVALTVADSLRQVGADALVGLLADRRPQLRAVR